MRAWLERLTIRAQIGLLALAVVLLLAAVLAWALAQDLRNAREAAYARIGLVANAAAEDIGQYLIHTEELMRRLGERPLVRALDSDHCDPLLAEHVLMQAEFVGYGIRDPAGRIICSYQSNPIPLLDLGRFPWFGDARLASGLYASNALASPRLSRWITVLVWPIPDSNGAAAGFLTLPVDLQRLSERLLGLATRGAEVTVLDRDRKVLMRSRNAQLRIGEPIEQGEGETATAGFMSTIGRDGVSHLQAYATVPGVGWRVIAALPEAEVFAGFDQMLWRAAGSGAAVLVLAAGLAWRLSRAIARPIAALAQTATAVAAGDRAARVCVSGPAEVAAVGDEFNRMLDARDLSEARLRSIFESATDAIVTADESQTIVIANRAAARMLHCTVDALLGSPLERWMPERYRAAHGDDVRTFGAGDVFARHMGRSRDVVALRADGEEFPVEVAVSHVEVGSQRLYTAILRDVTLRREVEQALRDSEARTRRLMSLLPHAVYVESGGRFAFLNAAALRLFGGDEAQLLGQPVFEHLDPGSIEVMRSSMAALRAGHAPATAGDVMVVRPDGSARTVEAVATWFEDHGSSSLLVVLLDVTELKQAQIALRESHADLQRLVEAQDKLLENERRRVARELHDDLQQTLAAIRIDLGAIGERLRADPVGAATMLAEVDDLAAAAIASTRRIVNDLRPRMLEDLGLAPALEALAAQFQQRTGIAAHVDADPRASETALTSTATTTCLYRVAQESLNNVVKHAQANAVELQLELADHRLLLRVTDDGTGFDADLRRKPESFGLLGMHERVRALGGTLRVDSRPGEGTAVEVELPAPEAAE